jgi:hypothetical protein
MSQSPELAGGEGFTYEGDVAAFYLTALLAEAYAPGIDDRIVVRVSVQQRDFGEPLDDVIVDFEDIAKNPARLSLQVKRSLTISSAITNTDFRDIIRDSWNTFKKPDFRVNIDRYGAAVGTISSTKERSLKTLCDWARESLTVDHFDERFVLNGIASKEIREIRNDILALLKIQKGESCTSDEAHQFFAHFVLIQFDFLREGAIDPPDAINRIRGCLAEIDVSNAPVVWSRIVQLARVSAGKSGQFDRARLVRSISPIARLAGAVSFFPALEKLVELAKSYANLIADDVGGTRLDRVSLFDELYVKLTTARIVQVRGLPGSGKSVMIKRAVLRALERGPVFFLKAEQLTGTSWIGYAVSHGLSDVPFEKLLVEVGAVGTSILFIDAIDRIEKEHQPVILDVIQTIVESPYLDNWQIVVSLRDSGIELLRNWLGDVLKALRVETLEVSPLSDDEAEKLAQAKPHLRPLLFGEDKVQEIVRRPFFAKVLDKSYVADPSTPIFSPQSEIDLVTNWWQRGGYNESGQLAIERQRTLLELAQIYSRQLSQPIRLGELKSVALIDELLSDDILQNDREGISIRFAHDIFFEWAFFHVLADCGPKWLDEIKSCGEPPAVARVVELASQWEFANGKNWLKYLNQTERIDIRSQWQRAWLVGPLGIAGFSGNEDQFAAAVFADDFRFFRKLLVWFQAEKTKPNEAILRGELLQENRQRIADLLGGPSDIASWRRLINFILRRISDIPQRLYPELVAIFDVWQNALSHRLNKTSHAILQQCAIWLASLDANSQAQWHDENSECRDDWDEVPERRVFRKSLVQLILRSSITEPLFTEEYLQRVIASESIREDEFHDIIVYSPVLSQSHPRLLIDLSMTFLKEELPDERVIQSKLRYQKETNWRNDILSKPVADRTPQEQKFISMIGPPLDIFDDFTSDDWDRLSIHDDLSFFWPPSPLREPFYSLFKNAPDKALSLLRALCNHAMTAWRQLHCYSQEQNRKPIPLELSFPWGMQMFWGTEREYLWFRSTWAPRAIGSGFMALEDWCFTELERNVSVNELIQTIVEGNECIAVLGIPAMLALHTETVSEVTLPLFTSQRLLAADFRRMVQDLSQTANLIGFSRQSDISHYEAVKVANNRPVRKKQLSWMVPLFIFASDSISERARDAILNFKNNLPFQYEEERSIPELRAHLMVEAIKYAEMADVKNYQAYRAEKDSDQIAIVHVSPSASEPDNIARYENANIYLKQSNLWAWASKYFDDKVLGSTYTIPEAISLAKESDDRCLFERLNEEGDKYDLAMRRGAVAATAAIVLNLRDGLEQEDIEWARDVLGRAIRLPEKFDPLWLPQSDIPWHPSIYVARGIAADIRFGTVLGDEVFDLFGLVVHPLEIVSLTAIKEACTLWSKDPKLTWAALSMAFSLCHFPPRPRDQIHQYHGPMHTADEAQEAFKKALWFYENGSDWITLPLPPQAWVKAEPGTHRDMNYSYEEFDWNDSDETTEQWIASPTFWYSKYAAEILKRIPYDEILNSNAKSEILDFLAGVLDWTIQKIAPSWAKPNRRDHSATNIYELTHTIGSSLGHVAGLMPLADFQSRFLDPILKLEGDNCWTLLRPFTNTYICNYLYDAPIVPMDTIATLELCLARLLEDSAFKCESYQSGEFSGIHQPELVQILMFVSVERADLAARYVNGDWSEIDKILPLIDRFIRAGGWAASVMDPFLTLCERAKSHYPSEAFADQILAVFGNGLENLKGWPGTFIPARIAELVQHLAHRDSPMKLDLAQKFLRILDFLVDMGDRRSAALQLGESFREVRLSS